jgi:signal transduction histidine kinase
MSAAVIDFRRHRLAREHGARVTVDDEGREGFTIAPGMRFVFDFPVPIELEEPRDDRS